MEHQRKLFQQRGYSEDLLPKTQSQRTWKTFNYFTLWMGSVHNVPNYVMVGGFFILGLSTFSIMLAIILSAFFIAAVMVLNGAAGSKYGVPFAMILRASYGVRGALFPGLFSIPLPVSSAVMLVSYLPLLFSALVFSQQITFTARNIYRLALPLFVGIFLMALPPVYLQDLPLTLRPLLSNGLLVGILLAVLMDNLIPWERIE